METLRIAFLSSAALELLATISVAIVAVTVGLRLSHGSMTLGAGLVAILLAPEAYWPVRRVGAEYHAAADGAVALDAILAQLEPTPAAPGSTSTGVQAGGRPGEVRLAGVTYAYAGSPVPSSVTSTSWPGPGSPSSPAPRASASRRCSTWSPGSAARRPATVEAPASHYVTQRPFLATGSVRSALTIGHPATDDQLWEALRAVEVDGVVAALPGGLSADLGDDGFGLSAGQRQRLALARAWLSPETLLLLDEPTAHLDPEGAEHVAAVVAELAERRVVVAVTHRDELLAHADHHVVLTRASLTSEAEPDEHLRPRRVWWPSAGTVRGGLLGGIATAVGHGADRDLGLAHRPGLRAARHPHPAHRDRRRPRLRHGPARLPLLGAPDEPRRRPRDCSPSAGRPPTRPSSR